MDEWMIQFLRQKKTLTVSLKKNGKMMRASTQINPSDLSGRKDR